MPHKEIFMPRLSLLLLCFCLSVAPVAATTAPLNFTLTEASGKQHRAEAYRGQELLLVAFSPGCSSCRAIMPQIEALAATPPPRLTVLGIEFGKPRTGEQPAKPPFTICQGSKELGQELKITQIPTLLWVDEQGRLRERFVGKSRVVQALNLLRSSQRADYRGLTEVENDPQRFVGTRIMTGGVLREKSKKTFYQPAAYILTNGVDSLALADATPLLATPRANRPLLISGLVIASGNQGVTLKEIQLVSGSEAGKP